MASDRDTPHASAEGSDKPTPGFHPDLTWREQMAGHRPGDKVVRLARHRYFYAGKQGSLLPRPSAVEPHGGVSRLWWKAKRALLGAPIPTIQESQERLSKIKALPVLSSDALSSVAYASEAAMRVLIVAGVGALAFTLPISIAIAVLLGIVATSYQQTISAYPSGGGSYIVANENLGVVPGLTAGTALMVGYVLTVAVSIAAGVDALISAFPELRPFNVQLGLGAVVLITVLNLRGVRESGTIFAIPTYVFLASILAMIAYGLLRLAAGGIPYEPVDPGPTAGTEALTWFLVLSAFSKGCSAMTGTEAISNAVPAFQPPESRNARITLFWMAGLLAVMFIGISFLVTQIGLVPDPAGQETVLSQLTRAIVGQGWYYYLVQFSTALILLLAANTCYAGFPWLLSVMARDRYVPSWFGLRGDRLVFSTGMIALASLSCVLLVVFSGSVDKLLPLYAIGVFTAFTLSQSGMVVHWIKGTAKGRTHKAVINGIGAFATAVVTLVVGVTKFEEGAWMVIVVVPILILICLGVHNHYQTAARQLAVTPKAVPKPVAPMVILPISSYNLVTSQALAFAMGMSKRVIAVHVASDPAVAEALRAKWQQEVGDVPLVTIESPYRLVIPPLLAYVDALRETHPDDGVVVMLPEFVPKHWWEHLLHNQSALRLKAALLFRPGVVVASFPYQLS